MVEGQLAGMQGLAGEAAQQRAGALGQAGTAGAATAIERIADQRHALVREMHADLVRAAGLQSGPHMGVVGVALVDAVMRDRVATALDHGCPALDTFDAKFANWVAFWIFSIAAITDFFDGYLARKWNQTSGFGRMLDPIADKAMVAIAGAVLMAVYGMSWIVLVPVTLILLREVMVSGLREYLKGAQIMDVTLLAKWKTTAQLFSMGLLFLAGSMETDLVLYLGYALLWVAAGLTVITGWDYFQKGIAYIRSQEDEA